MLPSDQPERTDSFPGESKVSESNLKEFARLKSGGEKVARFLRISIPANSIRARLITGLFWSLASTVFVQLSAMASSILIARILGQAGFGEFSVIRSTVLLFGSLTGAGLGLAATKHVAELRESDPRRAGRVIGLLEIAALTVGGVASIACFALAHPIAASAMNAEYLSVSLRMAAILLVLNAVGSVQIGAISGFEAFKTVAWVSAFDALISMALGIVGAMNSGLNGAIIGLASASALGICVKHVALRRECARAGVRASVKDCSREISLLWAVAIPITIVAAAVQPFEWLGRILLARQPNGFVEVGIYAAAQSWSQVILLLPSQLAVPSLPILASLYAAQKTESFRSLVIKSSAICLLCGITVAMPLLFMSTFLMKMYGASFEKGSIVLVVLGVTYSIAVVTMALTQALVASGRMWLLVAHKMMWGGAMALSLLLFFEKTALGLAYACAIGNFVFVVAQAASATKLMRDMRSKKSKS